MKEMCETLCTLLESASDQELIENADLLEAVRENSPLVWSRVEPRWQARLTKVQRA